MTPEGIERHLPLPAGIHRQSGEILSLAQCLDDPAAVADVRQLSETQRAALVAARWCSGEWGDLIYGNDGLVDLARALHELERRTEIGLRLMAVELRSMEMVVEDTAHLRGSR